MKHGSQLFTCTAWRMGDKMECCFDRSISSKGAFLSFFFWVWVGRWQKVGDGFRQGTPTTDGQTDGRPLSTAAQRQAANNGGFDFGTKGVWSVQHLGRFSLFSLCIWFL